MASKLQNMTQTMALTTRKGVGSQRWQRPVYRDGLAPCNDACPAGENVQGWLAEAQAGRYREAWEALTAANPLPAIHGRACYHPCETACNRGQLDASVGINSVERFLGDRALEEGWAFPEAPASGKRVLVVGAGPAGLSCAYHLARRGHRVEIHDANPEAGGMLQYGIPSYRLPRDVVQHEAARILAMPNVELVPNHRIDDLRAAREEGSFDAVFVSVGAQISNHTNIPTVDGRKLADALSVLEEAKRDESTRLGRVVAIVGGGNVAIDAARTARRLGAQEAIVIYRRDAGHMRALESETHEALVEGVRMKWMSVVTGFSAEGVTVEKVAPGPDGALLPTGEVERLDADAVLLAIGEHSDLSLLAQYGSIHTTAHDEVVVDDSYMTGEAGIFAGGDCIGGARTMTAAVGHGRKAAAAIDDWLAGRKAATPPARTLIGFEKLHLPDYLEAPRQTQAELPPAARAGFGEVTAGLDEPEACFESQRCLSCGNCFECDNCYAACPEQAIARRGPGLGYAVDLDLCTGCAVCFEQCPCHAIEMIEEPASAAAVLGSLGEPLAPGGFKVRP